MVDYEKVVLHKNLHYFRNELWNIIKLVNLNIKRACSSVFCCFLRVLVLWTIKQGCINSSRQLPVTSFTKRKQNPLPGRTETDPSQSTSPPAGISHAESESLALVTSRNGNQNRSKDLVRRAAARRVNQVRRGESSERACRASDLSRLACDKLTPSTATTVTNTHTHILLEPVHWYQGLVGNRRHARASRAIKLECTSWPIFREFFFSS